MKKLVCVFLFLALISCKTSNNYKVNQVDDYDTLIIEHNTSINIVNIEPEVRLSDSWLNYYKKYDDYLIIWIKELIESPVTVIRFEFIKQNDTMRVYTNIFPSFNHYLDKVPFKKGDYTLDLLNADKKEFKGEYLFNEKPKLKNLKLRYLPYISYEGEVKQLKEIPFHYYEIGEEGVTLKEVEKKIKQI